MCGETLYLEVSAPHHSDLRDYAAGVYLSDIYVWRMAPHTTFKE